MVSLNPKPLNPKPYIPYTLNPPLKSFHKPLGPDLPPGRPPRNVKADLRPRKGSYRDIQNVSALVRTPSIPLKKPYNTPLYNPLYNPTLRSLDESPCRGRERKTERESERESRIAGLYFSVKASVFLGVFRSYPTGTVSCEELQYHPVISVQVPFHRAAQI